MRSARPRLIVACLLLGLWAMPAAGQTAAPAAPKLTPEQMEAFLLKAKVVSISGVGSGVTNSQRASLSDGQLTHDVHIQSVDISKPLFEARGVTELNFKDSYRFNIAGYRLARLVGLTTVPMSVERSVNGKVSAVTWWVDDVKMDEKERMKRQESGPQPARTSQQIQVMRIWDELIQNRDRNQGNILWTSDFTLWLIDHTRAFRLGTKLLKPDQLDRCDRAFLNRLRALDEGSIAKAVGDSLTKEERQAILARRDLIVKHYEERIKQHGEAVILFSL